MKYLNLCWKLRLQRWKLFFFFLHLENFSTSFLSWLHSKHNFLGLLFIFEFGSNYFVLFMLGFFSCLDFKCHTHSHTAQEENFSFSLPFFRPQRCFWCGFCVHMRGWFQNTFFMIKKKLSQLQTYFVFTRRTETHTPNENITFFFLGIKGESFKVYAKSLFSEARTERF